MRIVLGALVGLLASCVDAPALVDCGDGRSCPPGYACGAVGCISPDQSKACRGLTEDAPCSYAGQPGFCRDGACSIARCGDGALTPDEACDDGNLTSGDGCSADCLSQETCGNGTIDALRGEQCDDGNHVEHDGCSSACRDEVPQWRQLTLTPGPRGGATAAYDPVRAKMVAFGGTSDPTTVAAFKNDVVEWDGRAWTSIVSAGAPSRRVESAMAFDARAGRMLLFGGDNAYYSGQGDAWQWDGARWTLVDVTGAANRLCHIMVYDPKRQRIVLFGGRDGNTFFSDTYTLEGNTWVPLVTANHPSARCDSAAAYDAKRGVIVLVGGYTDNSFTMTGDTWELDGTDWHLRSTSGPLSFGNAAAWDPQTQRVILFGGDNASAVLNNDTWSWNGSVWTKLAPATLPAPRMHMTLVDSGGTVVMSGGNDFTQSFDQTWRFINGNWVLAKDLPARADSAVSQDIVDGITVVFGGRSDPNVPGQQLLADTWVRARDGWTQVSASGPSAREGAAFTFDPVHAKSVLFGGRNGGAIGETWLFDGASRTWSQYLGSQPPVRAFAAMAFDADRGRTVMFSGVTTSGVIDDTWEWDGNSWTQVPTTTKPPARARCASAYDPIRKQVVVFGGNNASTSFDDTWLYDGDWHQATPISHPPRVFGRSLTWSPARQTLILTGGTDSTWEWNGSRWDVVPVSQLTQPRYEHIAFRPTEEEGIAIFGGQTLSSSGAVLDETWILNWDSPGTSESCLSATDSDGDGLARCDDPDCWAVCSPLCPPATSCPTGAPRCGDGACAPGREDCLSCAADCGVCAICGDGECSPGEICPGDCGT